MKRRARVLPLPTEHQEQVLFFQLLALSPHKHALVFAVPNGGKRHIGTAMKLKREGVMRGMSDIIGLEPRGKYHGILIEMKREGEYPTPEQKLVQAKARAKGYKTLLCYTGQEAFTLMCAYLEMKGLGG
jgi:hypothetical protein